MNVVFDHSFSKSIDRVASASVKKKIESVITILEEAKSLRNIPNLKKMEGYKTFYRMRIGEYRIGFELLDSKTILMIIVAHRKDIYKIFP